MNFHHLLAKRSTRSFPLSTSFGWLPALVTAAAAAFLVGCGGGGNVLAAAVPGAPPPSEPWVWQLPEGFAPPVVPPDNPMNAHKVALGRRLFHDVRLSGNGTQACSSCHAQVGAFTDNRALSRGATGDVHPRNAQPLANVAYVSALNWANPTVTTLEQQMLTPLFGTQPVEMGVNESNRAEVLGRLSAQSDYRSRFAQAFPGEASPLSWDNVVKAIAAFQRTLISANSRYDRALAGREVLTEAETRGMQLFFGDQALCARCHGGPNFNGHFRVEGMAPLPVVFHNTGLFNIGGTGAYPEPNRGVYEFTRQAADMGKFRAASLRNVVLTAPYMHDGSVATLEAVLDLYAAGGREVGNGLYAGDGRLNPYKDPLLSRIRLSVQDKSDLVAFLKTLSDTSFVSDARFADPFNAETAP